MKGLVIAGGRSQRMQTEKASLIFQGQPLHQRAVEAIRPFVNEVYISARPDSEFLTQTCATPLFDRHHGIGPAAALMRAWHEGPDASWLVLAVDFPNIDTNGVRHLLQAHQGSDFEISCYAHLDGTPEPLFAIWTPAALRRLARAVSAHVYAPMRTLLKSSVQKIPAPKPSLLLNTNTPREWLEATQ